MNFEFFDDILDAVFIYDQDKKIIYCNEACATLIGTSLRRLKPGKFVHEFLQFEDEEIFFMPNGTLGFESDMMYREIAYSTKSNKTGTALINIRPMQVPGVNGEVQKVWMAAARDMSLEIELHKKYHKQLEEKEGVIIELQKAKEKLEEYSHNLEEMVKERTEELRKTHHFLDTMINSLDQGLLVFNKDNDCLPVYTKACETIFDQSPKDNTILNVLNVSKEKDVKSFNKWNQLLYTNMIPFKDAAKLGPNHISNNLDHKDPEFKYIGIEYFPMENEEGELENVVTVATDKTDEVKARRESEEKEAYVSMIVKILKNKEQFMFYIKDYQKIMDEMDFLIENDGANFSYGTYMRGLHSVKGGSALYSVKKIHDLAHDFEGEMQEFGKEINFSKNQKMITRQVKILKDCYAELIDNCKSFLGEEVLDNDSRVVMKKSILEKFYQNLVDSAPKEIAQEFDEAFLKTPIGPYFFGYENLVQDLSAQLGKSIRPIEFLNADLKISPQKFTEFFSSLVHLFRNCIDHGIEFPDTREENQKNPEGTIKVSFDLVKAEGNKTNLEIVIEDDGGGINPEKIRERLAKNGASKEVLNEKDEDVIYHIFDESFSTRDQVTEISGRGVGMDAIKTAIKNIDGKIELTSKLGEGSRFKFIIPY